MKEPSKKFKQGKVLLFVLSIGLVISLGINGWLYSQLSSMNITGMQTELSAIQTEYETLSQKIEQGKQSLSAIQEENSTLEQEGLPAQAEVVQEKPAASPPVSENNSSNAGTGKQPPSQSSNNGGNTGGGSPLRPEIDKNQNGIVDALEENISEAGGTVSDDDFNLGTDTGESIGGQRGVEGSFPKTAADANGDGIDDAFQQNGKGGFNENGGTVSDDDFNLQ